MMIPVAFSFAFALAYATIYNATATWTIAIKIHPLRWISDPHFRAVFLYISEERFFISRIC